MSVLEVVRIASVPGRGDELGPRLAAGLTVQAEDPECLAVSLHRSIERPDEYLLELWWSSVEAHHAWQTEGRERWRARVGWDIVDSGSPMGLKHYTYFSTIKGEEPPPELR